MNQAEMGPVHYPMLPVWAVVGWWTQPHLILRTAFWISVHAASVVWYDLVNTAPPHPTYEPD